MTGRTLAAGLTVVAGALLIAGVLIFRANTDLGLPADDDLELTWTEVDPLPVAGIDDTVWTGERFLVTGHGGAALEQPLWSSADGMNWVGSRPFAPPPGGGAWIGGHIGLWANDDVVLA